MEQDLTRSGQEAPTAQGEGFALTALPQRRTSGVGVA